MSEPNKKISGITIVKWIGLCLLIGLLFAAAIPNFIKPRMHYSENACVNNLRQIETAKEKWAAANGKTDGAIVTEDNIKSYLKLNLNENFPGCPSGGKYSVGKIGENPTCSLGTTVMPPHVLP